MRGLYLFHSISRNVSLLFHGTFYNKYVLSIVGKIRVEIAKREQGESADGARNSLVGEKQQPDMTVNQKNIINIVLGTIMQYTFLYKPKQ